jgi:hypothetical protein
VVAAAVWAALLAPPQALAQARSELGPLCTSEGTPADKQIGACNKIIALKVFSGDKLATVYFWRAVAWSKKGDYARRDCFVARAPRNDGVRFPLASQRHCERSEVIQGPRKKRPFHAREVIFGGTRFAWQAIPPLLPPHLGGDLDGEAQLGPLLVLTEDVAFLGGSEAALRRQRQLFQRREFRRFV